MSKSVLAFLFLITIQPTLAQKFNGNLQRIVLPNGKISYVLKGKTITYDNGISGYFYHSLSSVALLATAGNNGLLTNDFSIESNHFIQSKKTLTDVLQDCTDVNLWIDKRNRGILINNHFEQPLVISGLSGTISLNGNYIPYMRFSYNHYGDINLSGDTIVGNIDVSQTKYGKIEILDNVFKKDTARIDVMYSSLDNVVILGNKARVLNIYFTKDTIGPFEVWGGNLGEIRQDRLVNDINFFDCKLTNLLMTDNTRKAGKRIISFNECEFTKDASLLQVSADTIEFRNCLKIENGMYLQAVNRESPTILKFYRTDLNNIDFEYDSRYQLYKSPYPDLNRSVYEKLLVKFGNEKKMASYERVDKEYFCSRHGLFVNVLSWLWWDYGYNKWLIILWTLAFLFSFSWLNYRNWKDVSLTYPIKRTADIGANAALKIFIYTAFIFFSLKIDFDKLSFKRTGWLVYFFAQYIVGLLCLFFIANAILKLS